MDAWAKPTLNRAQNPTSFYEAGTKACAATAEHKGRKPQRGGEKVGRNTHLPDCKTAQAARCVQKVWAKQEISEERRPATKSFNPGLTTKIRRRRAGCKT
jgi:hypothetical protein